MIKKFQMPDKIYGEQSSLIRVDPDDKKTVADICDTLYRGNTLKRIKKTMGYFSETPDDIPPLIKSLNRSFEKGGFNYFIFMKDDVIGQICGIPQLSGSYPVISLWGWIGDDYLRQGYMTDAVKSVEYFHFKHSMMSMEIFLRPNPIVQSFIQSINYQLDKNIGEQSKSYFKHYSDWENRYKNYVIASNPIQHDLFKNDLDKGSRQRG